MPMRKSNRSSFIILFPVARKTLEVKLGTDIRFLRKCSQNSIKFQGSGVCVGEDYGPRSGSTVDIPSVLISREAHRENLQGDTATVTITQRFFRMPKSFVKPKNFTVLLLNAPHNIYFFFSISPWNPLRTTRTCCSPLRSKSFVDWKALHCFFLVTTINCSFSGQASRLSWIPFQLAMTLTQFHIWNGSRWPRF